jgi:hypothetical protein
MTAQQSGYEIDLSARRLVSLPSSSLALYFDVSCSHVLLSVSLTVPVFNRRVRTIQLSRVSNLGHIEARRVVLMSTVSSSLPEVRAGRPRMVD